MNPFFQDSFAHIQCYGCGAGNSAGLQLKSRWVQEGVLSCCEFLPQARHCAGPLEVLNGGIIATVLDCHAVCTAMARAYLDEGRALNSLPAIQYATVSLAVQYLRPAAIHLPLLCEARVMTVAGRKTTLALSASSGGQVCATAELLAVRVPTDWRGG